MTITKSAVLVWWIYIPSTVDIYIQHGASIYPPFRYFMEMSIYETLRNSSYIINIKLEENYDPKIPDV